MYRGFTAQNLKPKPRLPPEAGFFYESNFLDRINRIYRIVFLF